MSQTTALTPTISPATYLALEEAATEKHEYIDGEIIAMAGVSLRHITIADNLMALLRAQRHATTPPYKTFSSDIRIGIPRRNRYTYPDGCVVCEQPELLPAGTTATLLNPTLIIEVLSPSTAAYDMGDKFAAYQTIASFREYLLVSQERVEVIQWVKGDSGQWAATTHTNPNAVLALASVPVQLPLAAVYEDVSWSGEGQE